MFYNWRGRSVGLNLRWPGGRGGLADGRVLISTKPFGRFMGALGCVFNPRWAISFGWSFWVIVRKDL